MSVDPRSASEPLVTGAEIARLAGVTRAAVSNWRRRHEDFPAPAGGRAHSPLFRLAEVRAWLARQDKGQEAGGVERVWRLLRGEFGDDLVRGIVAVARLLVDSPAHAGREPAPDTELVEQVRRTVRDVGPAQLVEALTGRLLQSSRRPGSEPVTSPRLLAAVRFFAEPVPPGATVLDPACGVGSLLLGVGRQAAAVRLGQELDPDMAELARLRAVLAGDGRTRIRSGDSLRADRWPQVRADLVVCDPPSGWADWGRDELMLDPRWELGVPSRAESELAWLQHAYAHTAPGGRAVLVMPASVAYRKAGRRIRAELVRRGVLRQVVGLPPGVASGHTLPVHLWFLERPTGDAAVSVRMIDVSANPPGGPFAPRPEQAADVPLIELLDDVVDLTPSAYVAGRRRDAAEEYRRLCARLDERLLALRTALPGLAAAPGAALGAEGVLPALAELVRVGLVEFSDGEPVSASEQLDTDFLQGFLAGASGSGARRRATASGSSSRPDPRGARVPQMGLAEQRRYGAAFRALRELERQAREVAAVCGELASLGREGLVSGALAPVRGAEPGPERGRRPDPPAGSAGPAGPPPGTDGLGGAPDREVPGLEVPAVRPHPEADPDGTASLAP